MDKVKEEWMSEGVQKNSLKLLFYHFAKVDRWGGGYNAYQPKVDDLPFLSLSLICWNIIKSELNMQTFWQRNKGVVTANIVILQFDTCLIFGVGDWKLNFGFGKLEQNGLTSTGRHQVTTLNFVIHTLVELICLGFFFT